MTVFRFEGTVDPACVAFKYGKTGAFLGMRQSPGATQPEPVAPPLCEPSFGTYSNRAVVRMFYSKLEKDFECRPFSVAPAEDVCPLCEEGPP